MNTWCGWLGGLIVFAVHCECSGGKWGLNGWTVWLTTKDKVMKFIAQAKRIWMMLVTAGVALHLSSCGGGGETGPVASSLDFPIASTRSTSGSGTSQYTLSGSVDGTNVTMSYSQAPGASSTFEGKPASTIFVTIIWRENGALASQSISRSYFLASPYVWYGSVDQGDGSYTVANQIANFPAVGKVGQSGFLGTTTEYTNINKVRVLSTSTATWSLATDTAVTALLCVNSQISGASPRTVSDCRRIDSSGIVLGHVLTITANGKTLTLT